jgi:hypothetical protein
MVLAWCLRLLGEGAWLLMCIMLLLGQRLLQLLRHVPMLRMLCMLLLLLFMWQLQRWLLLLLLLILLLRLLLQWWR